MSILLAAAKAVLLILLAAMAFAVLELGLAADEMTVKDAAQCLAANKPSCLFIIF